jgi:S-adenosylmethionine hydrolase
MARSFTRVVTTPAAARAARDGRPRVISLLTDWGLRDPSAAICRGVIMGIVPDALIVDISHEVEKYSIRHGALLLWSALPWLPVGAHVAVVDPGVGTSRRAIALEVARGDYLVGPDNGLLLPAAERLGGITAAHAIDNVAYRLPSVSSTFHGRDIFAPAAAHLAAGVPLAAIGPPVSAADLVTLDWPSADIEPGRLRAAVIYVDTFGNVKLSALASEVRRALGELAAGDPIELLVGDREPRTLRWATTFGDVAPGEDALLEDSYGRLSIARNQASAAAGLQLRDGDRLTLSRAANDQAAEAPAS